MEWGLGCWGGWQPLALPRVVMKELGLAGEPKVPADIPARQSRAGSDSAQITHPQVSRAQHPRS